MSKKNPILEIDALWVFPRMLKWLFLALVVGIFAGSASALFLWALDEVTEFRESHLLILVFLPLAGFAIGWIYHHLGKDTDRGNNLILEEIHDPKKTIPLRMTPLVLLSTLLTHLLGGSAGREGTAVQMGASLADQLTRPFRLDAQDRRILLMAGMSAGFASVFGTPLAGAVFGLEVLATGRLRYDAIFPCFIAAIFADQVALFWGVHHTVYVVAQIPHFSFQVMISSMIAGLLFGLTGMAFAEATHAVQALGKRYLSYPPLRPVVGGALLVVSVYVFHTAKFLGLGIPMIQQAFLQPMDPWDFIIKLAYTALTLGAGFKGGEVTPLFFIGATLGNALAPVLHLPLSLLAAMGFVGVFAGASNTPLASTLIALELFGPEVGIFAAIACVVSYMFSGHTGIYGSQRIGVSKHPRFSGERGHSLKALREFRKEKPH